MCFLCERDREIWAFIHGSVPLKTDKKKKKREEQKSSNETSRETGERERSGKTSKTHASGGLSVCRCVCVARGVRSRALSGHQEPLGPCSRSGCEAEPHGGHYDRLKRSKAHQDVVR